MTCFALAAACAALLLAPNPAAAGPLCEVVAHLIDQLGSPRHADREGAARMLWGLGGPSLPALRQAATSNPDLEIRRRAAGLATRIDRHFESERLLTPPKVRLRYDREPLQSAVADFVRLTDLPAVLVSDPAGGSPRTVTLDTGEVTPWQAFEQFC
jgi:hypothetical protein